MTLEASRNLYQRLEDLERWAEDTSSQLGNPTPLKQIERGTWRGELTAAAIGYKVINVKDYGAKGDNSTDDTDAISDAYDAAIDDSTDFAYSTMYFPAGQYVVTSLPTINKHYMTWCGDGRLQSRFVWFPSADGTLINIGMGEDVQYGVSIKDIGGVASGSSGSIKKTFIKASDVSGLTIKNCSTGDAWTGGTGGSEGIRLAGREAVMIDGFWGSCDRPIVIGENPNSTISCDDVTIKHTYLSATAGYAIVDVDNDVTVKSLRILDNHAWGHGKYGLRYTADGASEISHGIVMEGVHWENEDSGAAHFVHIDHNYGLLFFHSRNCINTGANSAGGYYIRGVDNVSLDSAGFMTASTEAFDITCNDLRWNSCWFQANTTSTLTGMTEVSETGHQNTNAPHKANGHYVAT